MRITPVDHGLGDLLAANAPGFHRTPGLHMSDLYNSLYQQLEPERYRIDTRPDKLKMEAGMSLERMVEEGLKQRLIERPGELVEPEYGIIYSPDLLIYNGHVRVGEIKLTWLSTREVPREPGGVFPPTFGKYVTQMACYCRCLHTPYARLIGFFVNGDYGKTTRGPELLAWDIEFTKREMDEEWQAAINHGKQKGLIK